MTTTPQARLHLHTREGQTYSSIWFDEPTTPLHWPPRILSGAMVATITETRQELPPESIFSVITETTVDRSREQPGGPLVDLAQAPRDSPHLFFLSGVLDLLPSFGLTRDDVAEMINSATSTWAGRNGATVHSRDGWQVVVGSDGTILRINKPRKHSPSTGPRSVDANPAQDKRRGYSSATTKRRNPPSTAKEFRELMEAHGFTVTDGDGGHFKATHPDYPGVTTSFPKSPSDHRWSRNAASAVKHQFGIDLLSD